MKLLDIVIREAMTEREIEKGKYWMLVDRFAADFVTDGGVWRLVLQPGWVWDKRSGARIINPIVPKSGNPKYNACVAAHDCSYSGWMSRALADNLFVRQGFSVSGQVSPFVARRAHNAVRAFGWPGYYEMGEPMPHPYTYHRNYESLILVDR
jgi:hypothetical protein